jgi:hypothetical protein
MSNRKKKIVFQSDFSLAKTGFGRNAKAILTYLHNTGKYDLVHYCCGLNWSNPQLARTPWQSLGCLPDSQEELKNLNKDPNVARMAAYGAHYLDKVIEQEKPDIYIAAQDIWGVDFSIDKPWFNKINSVIWTTLDSLPILPSAIEKAPKIKNYWIWSNFATKALHKLGHKHVKTVHGAVDDSYFFRLKDNERKELRKRHGLPQDIFMIGFVFRNQLRKSVPNLLEGYKIWKDKYYDKKRPTGLLLHTHFGEGWNILRLSDEYKIDKKEIFTTYVCNQCLSYKIQNFTGQDQDCDSCGNKKCRGTTNVGLGVTEEQLNEVYNLMDVYCHPFTSGGQEIPIQEAKLTELVTLVTDYSCGEEMCESPAGSLALDWAEYREHNTEFIKASTKPYAIAKNIRKVYFMKPKPLREMGEKARQWTLDNYSPKTIGNFIEQEIKKFDLVKYDFPIKGRPKDPTAVIPEIKEDDKWLIYLYEHILNMKVDEADEGHKYWTQEISKGRTRADVENYFRKVAQDEESKKEMKFEEILDKDDEGKRMLYVMPDSIGDVFLSTSLFKSLREQYPDYNLYVATNKKNFEVLQGNKYVHKIIPYISQMDSLLWLEGQGDHKGFFEVAFLPYSGTQRMFDYQHNAKDKIAFDLKY